jgi:long-chain acyl-CoA synthetase
MPNKYLKTGQEILISRFWSHVSNKADSPAVMVKNPHTEPYIHCAIGPMGLGSGVVTIHPPKYSDITWEDAGLIVAEITARLLDAGVRRGDRVALLSWNCPEWVWTDLAIQSLGAISVPIYPNNGADQVVFVAKNAGAKLIVADCSTQTAKIGADSGLTAMLFDDLTAGSQHFQVRVKGLKVGNPNNFATLTLSPSAQRVFDLLVGQKPGATFLEVTPEGVQPVGVTRGDTNRLIYTSGSSGVPKGVELTQGNIAASCEAVYGHGFDFGEDDLYLSYLPLAHVLENVNGMANCL